MRAKPSTLLKGSDPFLRVGLALALCLLLSAPALAVPPQPIPEGSNAGSLPVFSGQPATQHPVAVPDPPRHPFMAPNGRSNLHVDGYQSDVHQGPGPLGRGMERRSTFLEGVCASVTFDSRGRIVTVCVGVEGPKLLLLEPRTLETLAVMPLPPRAAGRRRQPVHRLRRRRLASTSTTRTARSSRRRRGMSMSCAETGGGTGFAIERDSTSRPRCSPRRHDHLRAAGLGRAAVVRVDERRGRGRRARRPGRSCSRPLGERIANSFAVEEQGASTSSATPRCIASRPAPRRDPKTSGARPTELGIAKPGQSEKGSGTTPTLMGNGFVAITDNADPMNVLGLPAQGDSAARGLPPAGLRQGRERHRPVADRRRRARWWSRTTTATPARTGMRARRRRRASSAST